MSKPYLERVVLGEERGPASWMIRVLLWPFSLIYCIGLWLFLLPYRVGLRKRYRLGVPVISVGNLTFGGTGKTPAVQTLCRMLTDQGRKVVVLSRGHGGSARSAVVASNGERILSDSVTAGDEPIQLAHSLPGIPIVVGRDRRESGRLACEQFSPDVIVLDDGLQYWQLHRDMDIVVLDARRPFGSGFVMPMGDLREPISGLRRAGAVLLNNADSPNLCDVLADSISKLARDAQLFRAAREPMCFRCAQTGECRDLSWIDGRRILAFCGIGQPKSFFDMLGKLGALIQAKITFPDHYRLTKSDINRIIDEARASEAEVVVTTDKDLARLGDDSGIPNLHTLAIRLEIEDSSRLAEYIANRIDVQN